MKRCEMSLFCWNIGNPSHDRAQKQAGWLKKRQEDVLVLTETKNSEGCLFLKDYFKSNGYDVIFSDIVDKEYGTMIVSKYKLKESDFSKFIHFIPSRVASTVVSLPFGNIEIIGLYIPSRNSDIKKIRKKKKFVENIITVLNNNLTSDYRIVCGDFNILEPNHIPHYSVFKKWEYDFYNNLLDLQLKDVFRSLNPSLQEYSWVGRTGDGYRYDHCFASDNIINNVKKCFYLHEPREKRLSDHSALITKLFFK